MTSRPVLSQALERVFGSEWGELTAEEQAREAGLKELQESMARSALERVWEDEWRSLTDEGRRALIRDFVEAAEEEEVSFDRLAAMYVRSVGKGNLRAYVDCLLAREW